jgi:hypothetical protein
LGSSPCFFYQNTSLLRFALVKNPVTLVCSA